MVDKAKKQTRPEFNEMLGEKASKEICKNAICYLKQILEAAPYQKSSLPPTSQNIQNKQDKLDTAGEVRTNSQAIFLYGLLYMGTPVLANQQGLTYIISTWTLDTI